MLLSTFSRPRLLGVQRGGILSKDGTCESGSLRLVFIHRAIKASIMLPREYHYHRLRLLSFFLHIFFFYTFQSKQTANFLLLKQRVSSPKIIFHHAFPFTYHRHFLRCGAPNVLLCPCRLLEPSPRDEEPCPEGRPVCTSGRVSFQAHSPPGGPCHYQATQSSRITWTRFMFTRTRAASNVVTDDTTSTAVHSVLNGDAVNWAVKEMCGLLCTHCRL